MLSVLHAIAGPSVCRSICQISQKRLKLRSCYFHHSDHTVAPSPSLQFLTEMFYPEILTDSPERDVEQGLDGKKLKTSYFLVLCVIISKAVRNTTEVTTIGLMTNGKLPLKYM